MRHYAVTSETWTVPAWARAYAVDAGQLTTCAGARAAELGVLAAARGHVASGPVTPAVRDMRRVAGIAELVAMDAGTATAAQIRTRIRAIDSEANDV